MLFHCLNIYQIASWGAARKTAREKNKKNFKKAWRKEGRAPRFFFFFSRAASQITEHLEEAIYQTDHSICPNIEFESSRYQLNINHTGNKPHSDWMITLLTNS